MERDVYAAMKVIKAECEEIRSEWEGKCPRDPNICPLYMGKCFFKGNKPHTWSIKSQVQGEKEWHEDV